MQHTGCSSTVQGGSDIGQVAQQVVSSSVHSSAVLGVNVDKQVLEASVGCDTVSRQLEDEWTLVTHRHSAKRISVVEGVGIPNPISAS